MPRARRIFLSIANELSPVILISGGPSGIVTYWIIAIVEFDRRYVLSGVRSRTCARAVSFLSRGKENVAKSDAQRVIFFILFYFILSGMRTGQESFSLLRFRIFTFRGSCCMLMHIRRAATEEGDSLSRGTLTGHQIERDGKSEWSV